MYFRGSALCEKLNQYKKIIIYGTGDFAQQIYPQLVQGGLKEKIISFTQTDENGPATIDGIPVVSIKSLSYDKEECVVLIAVGKLYVDQIKKILLEYNYPNIVSMVDYYVDYKNLKTVYRQLITFEEYCEYIADWYVGTQPDSRDNYVVIQKLLERGQCKERDKDQKLIVIICGFLSARIIKITEALKRKEYKIVMLEYFGNVNSWCLDALQKLDIQIYHCNHVAEMLYYALQYQPLIYLFEPNWGNCLWAEIMLRKKQYFGKIVLTLYDVLNDGYCNMEEDNLMTERYALEHADGIIWRWFSKEYLERKGFKYQGKSIQFLDYCNYENAEVSPHIFNASVIKLCMVSGASSDEYFDERTYSARYTEYAKLHEILACIGNREECIFHLYVGYLNEKNIMRCREYEKQYKNFKFFLGTEYSELINKLKNYDYACDLYIDGEEPEEDTCLGDYYGSSYQNSVCNSHFDCLSVGLPIITTRAEKMWEYLSDRDIVVKMNLSNLDLAYLKQQRKYYKAEVKAARQELDIDNQIARLIQFFREVQ